MIDAAIVNDTRTLQRRKWEDYRVGLNTNYDYTTGGADEVYGLQAADAGFQIGASQYNGNFDLTYLVDDMHYQSTSQVRLKKRSPVPVDGINVPIR